MKEVKKKKGFKMARAKIAKYDAKISNGHRKFMIKYLINNLIKM